MKRFLTLFVAVFALTCPARAEDTPMVWAFQHFCADETFTLDEVRLAIAVAGGKQRGPTATISLPTPLSVTFWDIVIQGHKFGISLGGQRVPVALGGAADMVACTVYADGNDEAGIDALRRWAAVAPSTQSQGGDLSVYRFVSEKGQHVPEPDALAGQNANTAWRLWQLYLLGGPHPNASLIRFFKIRERS